MNTPPRMLARGRRRSRPGAVAGLCLWAMLAAPTMAWGEGPGVRSSRWIFHPQFELGGAYDSNFFRDAPVEQSAPVNPVWLLTAGGDLKLANRSPRSLGISLELGASYREVFAAAPFDPQDAIGGANHGPAQLDERSGLDAIEGDLDLVFGPRSSFALALEARGRYIDEPATELLPVGAFRPLMIEAGPDLRFRPGDDPDSRALQMTLGYRFAMLRHLDLDTELGTAPGQKDTHKVQLETRWNFYPKTAALLDVQFWMINQQGGVIEVGGGSVALPDKDQTPFRLSAGLKGLLTPRLSATVKLGFANSFNNAGQSYQGLIANTGLEYVFAPRLKLRLTWRRKLDDDAFANYFVTDRFALVGELALPARFQVEGRFGVDLTDYSDDGRPRFVVGDVQETTLHAKVELGWHATAWLALVGGWVLEDNRTDFCYWLDLAERACPASPEGRDVLRINRAEFTRHRFKFTVRLSY